MIKHTNTVLDSITIYDENTVEVRYSENVHVELEDIKKILSDLYETTQNKRMKRLIVISKNAKMELSARVHLQEENKSKKETIIAEAIVVNSLTQKMTTNFYLQFIKDDYPSRFFTDINKAKDWLRNQGNS